jgi:hypothetical protein
VSDKMVGCVGQQEVWSFFHWGAKKLNLFSPVLLQM